jgi:hypothetical protein
VSYFKGIQKVPNTHQLNLKDDQMTNVAKKPSAEIIDIRSLGMGLKMVSEDARNLDLALTEEVLSSSEKFVADRPLRQGHVEHLLREMRRGTFIESLVTLIFCELDGVTYRMNGQHTCWAMTYFSDEADTTYVVKVQRWKAESEHDLRRLYASIDRGAPRTKANVVQSYLVGTDSFTGYTNRQIQEISSGFSLWHWESMHDRNMHGGEDVAHLMQTDFIEVCTRVGNVYRRWTTTDHKHMMRAPVIGALYATFQKAPRIAEEFWTVVATGVGIDSENDARHRLRNHLMTYSIGMSPGKRSQSPEEMYRTCISAWNSFRDNREVRVFKPSSSRIKAK